MEKRVEDLRMRMEKIGLDGFLIMEPNNRRYISGFTGTAGVLLITKKQNILFTDFRYIDQGAKEAPNFEIIKYEYPYLTTINEVLKRLPVKQIGFESEFVTYNQFLELSKVLDGFRLLPQKGVIEELRMVKDPEEINHIKEAARIADNGFKYILNIIKPGITEREVARDLEYYMASQGATGPSFATIVASGKRSSLPHGVASDKIIEKGDFVTLDFGCVYKGYCSDMTRTIVVGNPTEKQKEIYNIVLQAQTLGLASVKAGLGAKEIDKVSRDYIESKGYGNYFGHGLGHGLGLNVHENPSLSPKDKTKLLKNMVVTIEPGIYIPDWGGVRIEDLVVVLEDGYDNLTNSAKELIIL
ncbi:MAG: aminopeptidase P family protein [Clostridia bacterium]|nr:aminopeptidase P family protein [Clostridia bacterium]